MKAVLFFLVAAAVASQALGQVAKPSGAGVTVNLVRRDGENLGLLTAKKFPCSQPDPIKFTFAWAKSNVLLPTTSDPIPNSAGAPTGNICYDVCGLGYRLAAVFSPPEGPPKEPPFPPPSGPPRNPPDFPAGTTPFLCRIKYTTKKTGTKTVIYGYYTGDTNACSAYSPEDGKTIVKTSDQNAFDCGCCGTINRDGRRWERGCQAVTASVDKAQTCPAGLSQAPTDSSGAPGTPGTEICSKTPVAGGADLWGTIDPKNPVTGQCFVAPPGSTDGVTTAPLDDTNQYKRFCYKINPYGGPPSPDCKNKQAQG